MKRLGLLIFDRENKELDFVVDENGRVEFTLDKFKCYQIIEIV